MKKILITEQQFNNLVNNHLNEDDRKNRITKLKTQFPNIPWNKNISKTKTTYEKILVKSDPTERLDYLPWVIKQYNDILKGKITNIRENEFIEDITKIKHYLEIFNKNKNKLSVEQGNINNYRTYKDLYDVISPYMERTIQGISDNEVKELIKSGQAEIIYEDNKWIIIYPKTERSSCMFGRGSEWCTTYGQGGSYPERTGNMFKSYTSHGTFNYVINKRNQKEKYAFFFDKNTNNVDLFDVSDKNITDQINIFFKNKKELLTPLINSGKNYYSWKFLLNIGLKDWISYIDPNTENLDLSIKYLGELSNQIDLLTELQSLNLTYNNLKEIPESIGNLKNLRFLNLQKNQLKNLPESIGKLSQLHELMLSFNDFTELPLVIGKLTNLNRLYLSNNKYLKNLPQSIKKLPNLKKLSFLTLKSIPLTEKELEQIRNILPNTIINR